VFSFSCSSDGDEIIVEEELSTDKETMDLLKVKTAPVVGRVFMCLQI